MGITELVKSEQGHTESLEEQCNFREQMFLAKK